MKKIIALLSFLLAALSCNAELPISISTIKDPNSLIPGIKTVIQPKTMEVLTGLAAGAAYTTLSWIGAESIIFNYFLGTSKEMPGYQEKVSAAKKAFKAYHAALAVTTICAGVAAQKYLGNLFLAGAVAGGACVIYKVRNLLKRFPDLLF